MYDVIANFIPFMFIVSIIAYILSFVVITKMIPKFKKRKPNGRHIHNIETVSISDYTNESLNY